MTNLNEKTALELVEMRNDTKQRMEKLVSALEVEKRKLNEEEQRDFDECKNILDEITKEETRRAQEAQKQENKNNSNIRTMENFKIDLAKEIRKSIENGTNKVELRANTFGGFVTGEGEEATQHDTHVIKNEIKAILEPLYGNLNILEELGITKYSGLPMAGNISVPVASKINAEFAGENADNHKDEVEFKTVVLSPKRISVTVPVSRMLLNTDTEGVEGIIRNQLFKAVAEALVKKTLSNNAKTDTAFAGIFNGVTPKTVKTYANLTDFESDLEDTGVDNAKFLLSPKAKALFKSMTPAKVTERIVEGNLIDGIEYKASSYAPSKQFVYGDFSSIVMGLWDENISLIVDQYSGASKGLVYLTCELYADAVVARPEALAFGTVE